MNRPTGPNAGTTLEAVINSQDLRAAISMALVSPHNEESLRRGVWTYVGTERSVGTSPGHVIMQLTELVEEAVNVTDAERQDLMRKTILWCVEAYFGHLGGDVVGRTGRAFADYPAGV